MKLKSRVLLQEWISFPALVTQTLWVLVWFGFALVLFVFGDSLVFLFC